MRGPEGGFYSALDADSEGEEGSSTSGTPDEIREALTMPGSADADERVLGYCGVTERGNFEGRNILKSRSAPSAQRPRELDDARAALYAGAPERVRPGLDDKRLASWNALMIAALADAGAVLGREDYLDAARGLRRASSGRRCATPTAACCGPGRTARRG